MAGGGTTAITVTGSEQVIRNLNSLGPEGQKIIQQAMQNAANATAATAKQNAPYLTGFLRSEIRVDSVTATKAVITSHAEYSIYQKDDFMGDALQSEAPKFTAAMSKAYSTAWQTSG